MSTFDGSVTIANGGTASGSLQTSGMRAGSYQIPAAFTGIAVTTQVSNDNSNWTAVDVEGNEANPDTVTTDGSYPLPLKTFNFKFFRLVSGSAEDAERTISVYLQE